MKLIIQIFIIFSLMPFISPVPINTDVQPLTLFIASLIFLIDLSANKVKFSIIELIFIFYALYSLLIFNIDGEYIIKNRIGLFGAFFTFYGIKKYGIDFISSRLISFVISIQFLGVLWHLFFPENFVEIASLITRGVKNIDFSYRGASGFAPENSFSAALAIFYFLMCYYLRSKGKMSKNLFFILSLMCAIIIILGKSGLGYIYSFLVIGLLFFPKISFTKIFSYVVVIIFCLFLISKSKISESRSAVLLNIIINNPTLLIQDTSVAERLVGIEIGILSLFNYPFGGSGGSYPILSRKIDSKYKVHEKYPRGVRSQLNNTVSSFGRYLVEHGFFFIIFLFLLFKGIKINNISIAFSFLAFLFIFVSFSILFPPIYWLVVMGNTSNS